MNNTIVLGIRELVSECGADSGARDEACNRYVRGLCKQDAMTITADAPVTELKKSHTHT